MLQSTSKGLFRVCASMSQYVAVCCSVLQCILGGLFIRLALHYTLGGLLQFFPNTSISVYYSVHQRAFSEYVPMCCSILQYATVYSRGLFVRWALYYGMGSFFFYTSLFLRCSVHERAYSEWGSVCCSVLHCVAVCCSVLLYVAVCCSVYQRVYS